MPINPLHAPLAAPVGASPDHPSLAHSVRLLELELSRSGGGSWASYLALRHDPLLRGRNRSWGDELYWDGRPVTRATLATTSVYLGSRYRVRASPAEVEAGMRAVAVELDRRPGVAGRSAARRGPTRPDRGLVELYGRVLTLADHAKPLSHFIDIAEERGTLLSDFATQRGKEFRAAASLRALGWVKRRETKAGLRRNLWNAPLHMFEKAKGKVPSVVLVEDADETLERVAADTTELAHEALLERLGLEEAGPTPAALDDEDDGWAMPEQVVVQGQVLEVPPSTSPESYYQEMRTRFAADGQVSPEELGLERPADPNAMKDKPVEMPRPAPPEPEYLGEYRTFEDEVCAAPEPEPAPEPAPLVGEVEDDPFEEWLGEDEPQAEPEEEEPAPEQSVPRYHSEAAQPEEAAQMSSMKNVLANLPASVRRSMGLPVGPDE